MDCNPPGSSVHGILQVRILEWVAIPFSKVSSSPREEPGPPAFQANSLPSEPPGKPRRCFEFHGTWIWANYALPEIYSHRLLPYSNCSLWAELLFLSHYYYFILWTTVNSIQSVNSSSCVWCTLRSNKLKGRNLEKKKVYFRAMQRDWWLSP